MKTCVFRGFWLHILLEHGVSIEYEGRISTLPLDKGNKLKEGSRRLTKKEFMCFFLGKGGVRVVFSEGGGGE
jgi:hypothetical protein